MALDHSAVRETFEEHKRRILDVLPSAIIQLSGSGLVEGLDSDDVDLVVLTSAVEPAASELAAVYPPLYPDEWRSDWAAFRDPGPPQVDVVVTVPGSRGDLHHRRAWEVLSRRLDLQAEYAKLRGRDGDHAEAKRVFFERIVSMVGAERLTLDTNLLQEYLREQDRRDVVAQLFDMARAGEVELVVTARINEDMTGELAIKLDELMATGVVGQIGSITRLGYWVLGRDMLGAYLESIRKGLVSYDAASGLAVGAALEACSLSAPLSGGPGLSGATHCTAANALYAGFLRTQRRRTGTDLG
jgi:hypothetical protein